ncbi:unnamed protein product [Moneuplotes crassus]|uniref:Rab-GAP TBC domain-containing protein n=2 Tax=Euplotes crassus TaxID=5936 RepID=A0AAD1XC02_EUPCR|nr:unnamed protein product [Moneuplotes crassus]
MNKSRTPIHSGTFKKAVKDELVKKKDINEDLNSLIPKIMNNHNLDTQIKNKVQEIMEKNRYFKDNITVAKNQFKDCVDCSFLPAFYKEKDFEPLESVANAKKIWNEQIKYKANVVARTVRKPFISAKAKGGKDVPEVPPIDLKEVDDPSCMFIFDQNTLFDSVLKVNSINYAGVMNLTWGSVKLQLQTMSVKEMRKKFNELNVTLRQIGVDDEKSFIDERLLQGDKLLSKDFRPLLINYARRGVPPSLRCRVYKKIFNIEMNPRDYEYYKSLNDHFSKWDLCIDDICNFDTNEVINDEKYFIFQDFIVQVTNLFFRDTWVLENMRSKPHATLTAIIGLDKEVGPFPPNGVLPCKHFSKFVCPFCYISTSPEDIYFIFRAFYAKYICQLHSLNSDSQGIIGLCKLFEDLLQTYEPEVFYYLNQMGINPLKTAFPWIFNMFIGYLEVSELFLLFDRIIGFDTVEIIPILAAAIFVYRSTLIANCTSQEEFEELFYDLSQIKVIPLLQHFLFLAS